MKKYIKIIFVLFLFTIINVTICFASGLGEGLDNDILTDVTQSDYTVADKFSGIFDNVFGTIFFILQVLGVAGIVINGVRYMYAGPDDKGKIKQSLIYIIIGTIFVFGAGVVVNLIENTWNDVV